MEYDSSKGPKDYIDDVYRCLKANGNYSDKVQKNTRCVTVNYAGEFKIDVVPCITYNGNHLICNRKTNEYEVTDGTGFRDWFNEKNRITNGNLKLVTRLLKYLRDHKNTFTAPSVLLTTLIGNTVHDWEGDTDFKTLPDALKWSDDSVTAGRDSATFEDFQEQSWGFGGHSFTSVRDPPGRIGRKKCNPRLWWAYFDDRQNHLRDVAGGSVNLRRPST